MQSLIGGADCSTNSNPLKQVLQREGVDNSLFKDRLTPTAGPSSQAAFRPTFQSQAPSQAAHLHANPTPHPFNLSHLSAALAQDHAVQQLDAQWNRAQVNGFHQPTAIRPSPPQVQPSAAVRWQASSPASAWSGDFRQFEAQASGKGKARAVEVASPSHTASTSFGATGYQPHMYPYQPSFHPMYSGGMQQMYSGPPQQAMRPEMNQKEMEDLFTRAEEDWKAADAAAEQTKELNGEKAEEAGQEKVDVDGERVREAKGDFEAVWESLRPEAERLGRLAEWEKDFSQFTNDEDDLFDVLNESLNRPDVGGSSFEEQFGEMGYGGEGYAGMFESEDGVPSLRAYEFASPNTHDSVSASAAWAEASRLLASGGSLTDAALLIESFIRRATAQDRAQVGVTDVEAWSLLGRVHAMDEKEDKALSAFEQGRRALEGDADGGRVDGVAGEMLTNLAISYVNESLDLAALTTLHQFLRILHPTSAGPAPSKSLMTEGSSPWALHQTMTDSFLALAREQWNSKGVVDPDVQVGLGTLYYMMGEYEQARDCWVAALGERPDDYLLWNRLGATLANGGSSEEAVDAYRRALELKPTFTRAIFNLGVACLNIGVYREAAEHFLAALSLHSAQNRNKGSGGADVDGDSGLYDSGSLWSTLRRSLNALDMRELADRARPGTDLGIFRQAGFEF